jgi:hypothetical protein
VSSPLDFSLEQRGIWLMQRPYNTKNKRAQKQTL